MLFIHKKLKKTLKSSLRYADKHIEKPWLFNFVEDISQAIQCKRLQM